MNPATNQQLYTNPQTGLPMQLQGPVVQVQAVQAPLTNRIEKYKAIILKLGIAEIALGMIILSLDIATLIVADDIGQGIWCGSVLIASGIIGVVARSQPSYCMFNANIALSILAVVFMITLVVLSSFYAAIYSYYTYYYWGSAALGLQVTIVVLSFTGLVIAIVHSAYSCACVCKCNGNGQNQVVLPVQMSNGQVIVGSNQMNQPAVYLAPGYQYANPALVLPTAQNQQPVFLNHTVPTVVVQPGPVESASEQRPEGTQPPPLYSYSHTK